MIKKRENYNVWKIEISLGIILNKYTESVYYAYYKDA